jgi:hypothetical protein
MRAGFDSLARNNKDDIIVTMKRILNFALMAATFCGLSFALTSCKDDDENNSENGGGTAIEESAAENANVFWSVAASLVSPFDVTADYKNKTFEPTIGEAESGNSTVRVVAMPDVEAAAAHFASIVDADVQEATPAYTYQHDAVGTLTYTKSTDGKSLATVNVNIKQIPHLQQIVYKTVEQMGTNAVSDGVPYYSFGDVVSRVRSDGVKEHWMCIQAPFTKQGSTEAVWATVSELPQQHVWVYDASNEFHYQVPFNIGNEKEYMKDLAEMLYAICNPDKWEENIQQGPSGMKAFNLVKKNNVKYINSNFWKRVRNLWLEESLSDTIFGGKLSNMTQLLSDDGDGLKLIYHGYSWWTMTSNNLSLYEATVKPGQGKEANARHLTWREVKKNVISPKIEVDCLNQLQNGSQWINEDFFDDDQERFIFRFATTRQLAGANANAFQSMEDAGANIKDEYVYTSVYDLPRGPQEKMDSIIVKEKVEYVANKGDAVCGVFMVGDVVKDENNALWFCISGAPNNQETGNIDNKAWFISLEQIRTANNIPSNILTEKQAPEVGIRLLNLMYLLCNKQDAFKGKDELGGIGQHILDYAKVNIGDLFVARDSIWHYMSNTMYRYFDSWSVNFFTNLAYIGNDDELKVMRCVYDHTQGGSARTSCIPKSGSHDFNYTHFRLYKHYQNSDSISWPALTDDERSLEMKRYQTQWPITGDWMRFSDLGSQDMVNRYALKDKWVTLPLTDLKTQQPATNREQPRKNAETILRPASYFMNEDGTFNSHLGMFNEPLLFVRVMTVIDQGGNVANLVSEDGRKLKVVHLQDDEHLYQETPNYNETVATGLRLTLPYTWLDNERYTLDFNNPK